MPRKTCNDCRKSKPVSEFYAHRRGKHGVGWTCKVCRKAAQKERYAAKQSAPQNEIVAAGKRKCQGIYCERDLGGRTVLRDGNRQSVCSYCEQGAFKERIRRGLNQEIEDAPNI